ncbi:MAG: patatin-like phospholipase family protein [Ferruginibacter sp.]
MSANVSTASVDVQAFIQASGVDAVLTQLKNDIAAKEAATGKPFIVSDVHDEAGNQYVDLVQEGGGVWGIALVGFTYILEKVGIRFFSLAGASAGAINTMMLAALGTKETEKAEKVIAELLDLKMFSFVDGKEDNWRVTKWIKRIIQKFILRKNYINRLLKTITIILIVTGIITLAAFILTFFINGFWLKLVALIALILWMVVFVSAFMAYKKFNTLFKHGYGVNEGKAFHVWMTGILQRNGIHHLADLKTLFSTVPNTLYVRRDEERDSTVVGKVNPPSSPMLTIISSDISTGNKIEFPRMWDLYWGTLEAVNPADFVRASMSIPAFFQTYVIPVNPSIKDASAKWKNHLNWNGAVPDAVKFVDGGALSNFPINVFYNAKYIIPRMPTIGIRLGGTNIQVANKVQTLSAYLNALLNTLQSNTDKDFMNKNKAFDLGIRIVDMRAHSWLNFFMEEKEKQEMFLKGAKAAADFILKFDWESYKRQRKANDEILNDQKRNPNNW